MVFGFVLLALFGCVPPSTPLLAPQVTAAPPPSASLSTTCADSNTFLAKVSILKLPYWPDPFGTNYKPPEGEGAITNASILEDLAGAFCIANQRVRNDLLSLKAIYINPCIEADPRNCANPQPAACTPDSCTVNLPPETVIANSWGFRDPSADKFIATSAALWANGNSAPVLTDYETLRLQALLKKIAGQDVPTIGRYVAALSDDPTAGINTSAAAVLAALAHEFGHAYWFDAFVVKANGVPNPGGPPDFTQFCGGKFYFKAGNGGTWAGPVRLNNTRWVNFGDVRNNHQSDDVDIPTLISHLRKGDFSAGDDLHGALSGELPNGHHNRYKGPWASPLAAMSPDEDFVETYQLYALTQAKPKLTSLQINIFGNIQSIYLDDIPTNVPLKSELKRKMQCF
jgi:hypothetical protein